MKRAEMMAWGGLAGLVVVAVICFAGGLMYHTTYFWAGMIVALSQGLVVGLAGWGLSLSRQAAELADLPAMGGANGNGAFGMTFGDAPKAAKKESGVRTLETGFQRILVGLTAVVLVGLSGLIFYLINGTFAWAKANPDKAFPVAGTFDKPAGLDELALVMGLGAAAVYLVMGWMTRERRRSAGEGEAVESTFALGALGFIGLGVAAVLTSSKLGFTPLQYVSEMAAGLMGGLLALQGVELLVNSMRSYSGVEELDQEAVDLQALPLVPMLASFWLGGVKMLLAQSVGLASEREAGERGVIARLMPRVLAALVILAIGASCCRVVPAGRVGVLERLGTPVGTFDGEGKALPRMMRPGLHVSLPWPIDTMVLIPTEELQYTDVGEQLHTTNGGENLDFQFWTIGNEVPRPGVEKEDEFVTGDTTPEGTASPQLLETYVGVWWRVADPVKFYNDLSHSDFYERAEKGTTALPIYAALVQQSAAYAVTKTFAIHPLEKLLITDRAETNEHCRQILQEKLDEAGSGIEIVDLTIKDLHPPFGGGVQDDFRAPGGKRLGPAHAFENVVAMREYREMMIDKAKAIALGSTNRAKGDAASTISAAQAERAETIGAAQGEAARLTSMMEEIAKSPDAAGLTKLAELNTLNATMKEAISGPGKVLVDPSVKVNVWETTKNGVTPVRAAGQ